MPEKHFYFSIGAAVGSGVSYLIGKNRHKLQSQVNIFKAINNKSRHWFLYFPVLVFVFGIWGLIPDIIHASGLLSKNITRGGLFDIFFFHSFFEQLEDTNKELDQIFNWIGQAILVSVSLGVMVFYIKRVTKIIKHHENNKLNKSSHTENS